MTILNIYLSSRRSSKCQLGITRIYLINNISLNCRDCFVSVETAKTKWRHSEHWWTMMVTNKLTVSFFIHLLWLPPVRTVKGTQWTHTNCPSMGPLQRHPSTTSHPTPLHPTFLHHIRVKSSTDISRWWRWSSSKHTNFYSNLDSRSASISPAQKSMFEQKPSQSSLLSYNQFSHQSHLQPFGNPIQSASGTNHYTQSKLKIRSVYNCKQFVLLMWLQQISTMRTRAPVHLALLVAVLPTTLITRTVTTTAAAVTCPPPAVTPSTYPIALPADTPPTLRCPRQHMFKVPPTPFQAPPTPTTSHSTRVCSFTMSCKVWSTLMF